MSRSVVQNYNSRNIRKPRRKTEEAATRGVLCKKVFLEISQNLQGNTCAGVSFFIKKRDSGTDVFL